MLPYEDEEFSRVYCTDILDLMSVSEVEKAIREISRVTSRYLCIKIFTMDSVIKSYMEGNIDDGAMRLLIGRIGCEIDDNYPTSTFVIKCITKLGFKILETRIDEMGNMNLVSRRRYDRNPVKPGSRTAEEAIESVRKRGHAQIVRTFP